ncbi:MAG: type III-A CRISPR-associated protein Csm2 [Candidatus Promineifilaceae bacterium]
MTRQKNRELVSPHDLSRIIVDGDSGLLVKVADSLGEQLGRQLTTSQIRNIFGTVRQIEMSWSPQADEEEQKWAARQLMLLKPKLAYQAKRERGRGVTMLAEVLTPAIDMVGNDRQKFQNFVDFFEAILAYHSAHGGF